MNMRSIVSRGVFLFPLLLFILSLCYRLKGLSLPVPFWVDEFSSAHQAQLFLSHGLEILKSIGGPPLYIEERNILTHMIIAASFKLFGVSEFTARLPQAFIGASVPVAVYFLAKEIFSLRVAVPASLLTATSYFQITWSRQARGYMLQQLLVLMTFYFYLKFLQQESRKGSLFALSFCILCGLLTHPFFYIVVVTLLLHYCWIHRGSIKTTFAYKVGYAVAGAMLLYTVIKIGALSVILDAAGSVNNLWYYHSFLWREYSIVTILALLGIPLVYRYYHSGPNQSLLLLLYICLHIGFISFGFAPYTTRYLSPLFPLLFILAAYTLDIIGHEIAKGGKYVKHITPAMSTILALLIIANGDTFVAKPKDYYSINRHFREISNIDYNALYNYIKEKGTFENSDTVIVETWLDRLHWYMGPSFDKAYELRWDKDLNINGLSSETKSFRVNANGEKASVRYPTIGFMNSLEDLKKAMSKYPKGFIFIDDATLPKEIIEHAQKNLKKELYLDHYPLDDNPYSIWPATLYSWGIQ